MTYYGARELAEGFRTVRKNTIQIAEDIPEDQYGFRPTPESRSVAEILRHVAVQAAVAHETHAVDRVRSYVGVDFMALVREWSAREGTLETKAQILDALRRDGETWAAWLASAPADVLADQVALPEPFPGRSRFEMILGVKEHEMHHRGQLMVYERLLGIVPHLTRQREAYAAQARAAGSAAR